MSRRTARDLASELGRLSRDVRTLQTATQLGSSSIEDGSTELYDENDELRQIIGIQPDGAVTVVDLNAPAPATPADPTIAVQPGLLIVSSYGLTADGSEWLSDFQRIDVHVGTSADFPASIATKVAEFGPSGGSVTLALDPGTYYVKLIALNTSGTPSVASGEISVTIAPPSTGAGGVKTYWTNDAPIGLGFDDEGSLWYDTDDGNKTHRWDGATWVAIILGANAVADDIVAGKQIPVGSAMSLQWGIPDPSAPLELWSGGGADPGFVANWEDLGPSATVGGGFSGYAPGGLVLDGTVWRSVIWKDESYVDGNGITHARLGFYIWGSDETERRLFAVEAPEFSVYAPSMGLTRIGTDWYVLVTVNSTYIPVSSTVYRYDTDWNQLGTWEVSDPGASKAFDLATDGTNVVLVRDGTLDTGNYLLEARNPTTGALVSTLTVPETTTGTLQAVVYGQFDYAADRIAFFDYDGVVTITDTTGAVTDTFTHPGAAATASWDGTRFVTGASYGLGRLRGSSPVTTSGTVWGAYSYVDSVGGDESAASPVSSVSVTIPARWGLTLANVAPPPVNESPAPDSTGVYLYTGATTPALADLRRVAATALDVGGNVWVADPWTRTVDAPPSVSSFPTGPAGALATELGDFLLKGDGTGDWRYLRERIEDWARGVFSTAGHEHPDYANIGHVDGLDDRVSVLETLDSWHKVGDAGEPNFQNGWTGYGDGVRFVKVAGQIIYLSGQAAPGGGGNVAFTLPVGYRPDFAVSNVLVKAQGTGNIANISVGTDGTVTVVGSGTSTWVAFEFSFYGG